MLESCESTHIDDHDYSFLRLPNRYIDNMVDDKSEPIYETVHFSNISNSFEHISGSTNQSVENGVEATALVAHVSYGGKESEGNNWIVGNGSTHHMKGDHTEFLYMRSDGYVDGVHLKGLTSSTNYQSLWYWLLYNVFQR